MGRRSYAAALALACVVFVLLFAASRPNTQTNVLRWVRVPGEAPWQPQRWTQVACIVLWPVSLACSRTWDANC